MNQTQVKKNKIEICPKCCGEYNPRWDEVLTCQQCGYEGSTQCCIPAGQNSICTDCDSDDNDEAEIEDAQYELSLLRQSGEIE